eukprot:3070015-Pyramimonas_sp.AAC.1
MTSLKATARTLLGTWTSLTRRFGHLALPTDAATDVVDSLPPALRRAAIARSPTAEIHVACAGATAGATSSPPAKTATDCAIGGHVARVLLNGAHALPLGGP